jgi:peptidoglycan hydrolase CwlO-like protein
MSFVTMPFSMFDDDNEFDSDSKSFLNEYIRTNSSLSNSISTISNQEKLIEELFQDKKVLERKVSDLEAIIEEQRKKIDHLQDYIMTTFA